MNISFQYLFKDFYYHDCTYIFKLEILAQALSACGRGDLAIDLRERDEEFRRRRAVAFRGKNANVREKYLNCNVQLWLFLNCVILQHFGRNF